MFGLSRSNSRKEPRRKRPYVPPAVVAELPLAQLEKMGATQCTDRAPESCDPVAYARSRMPSGQWVHCAFLGLDMEPDVVELWPSNLHSCFAGGFTAEDGLPLGEAVSLEHQASVCMNRDQQRSCPQFVRALLRGMAAESGRSPQPAVAAAPERS